MPDYLLAHDLGTSGDKATLFTTDGELVYSVTYNYPLKLFGNNSAEQDPEEWWRAFCLATKKLTEIVAPSDIAAVSFSGQMMGCLCVGNDGKALRDSLIWADMRSTEQEKQIRRSISEKEFYQITGHRISSSYSATKLMWIKDNEPDIYKSTYKMLNAKDYLILRLTGNFVTEPSDASSTCLMDLGTRRWSDELTDICGLCGDKLPDIIRSVDIAGKVTTAGAECGLLEGTPVVCGGGDGVCAAVGTGIVEPGKANCCLGTSSWISYVSEKPIYDPDMTTFNFAHIVPDLIMPCGTMQCGGGSLSWFAGILSELDKTKTEQLSTSELYDTICRAVEAAPPGAGGILFLPYLIGERSPRWNDRARGAFVGLGLEHNSGDMMRAVMEGVSMNLSVILDAFNKNGAGIDKLTLVGGGARNAVWRQIIADILDVTIEVPNYLEEATSMGAAITAGVGVGAYKDFNSFEKFLKTEKLYYPNRANSECYEKLKKAFDECYISLEKVFNIMYNKK